MNSKIIYFVLINICIFAFFLLIAFKYKNFKLTENKKSKISFIEFLNNGKLPPVKDLGVGLVFGIVFGLLDNIGLWMGIDTLNQYLPGGILTKSALGNTYSDLVGSIVGTSISIIAKDAINFDNDDMPIWVNTIGIFIGCLLGLFIGKAITNKN